MHDPDAPFKDSYDEELVLTLSDWYNEQMRPLIAKFLDVTNPTGAEPVPEAALLNDTQNLKVAVQPGKTYLLRIVNVGAFASQYLWFEDHKMQVVEVDGVYTDPAEAEMIYLTPAQRYSVLITMKEGKDANFAFVGSMDQVRTVSHLLSSSLTLVVGSVRQDSSWPGPKRHRLVDVRRKEGLPTSSTARRVCAV